MEELTLGPSRSRSRERITVEDASSSAGNLIITEDGGRQTVTYLVPPGEFEDDITFRINVGWLYFLIQFWVYPTIVLILLVMFVRRRRRKKKERSRRWPIGKRRSTKRKSATTSLLTSLDSPALPCDTARPSRTWLTSTSCPVNAERCGCARPAPGRCRAR